MNSNDNATGEELAKGYCSTCHLSPDPSLISKKHWEVVLPRMGARMGIKTDAFDPYQGKSMEEAFLIKSSNVYPEAPILREEDWKKINQYFLENAPDNLNVEELSPKPATEVFLAKFPDMGLSGSPLITFLEFDQIEKKLYTGDWSGSLVRYNPDFSIDERTILPSSIIDIERKNEESLKLLSIGQLYPNEARAGALVEMKGEHFDTQYLQFANLKRPVHFTAADIDGDGTEDYIVCNFGNLSGHLSWYKKGMNTYTEHLIKDAPGATKVFAEDIDENGFQDLIVLFGQGDEGVSIFFNEKGNFREKQIIRFPPIYGSNDMEYLDFDSDGDKDIITTHGDNGDHTQTLKPYHGVRIFINEGDYKFTEKYFYSFPGASKVKCLDFDQDGDRDLVAMSFFPDFRFKGEQSLIYLENQGNWTFEDHLVEGANEGRWMVMDAGDIDQDGDEDIVVGSFMLKSDGIPEDLVIKWKQGDKKVLFLENQTVD